MSTNASTLTSEVETDTLVWSMPDRHIRAVEVGDNFDWTLPARGVVGTPGYRPARTTNVTVVAITRKRDGKKIELSNGYTFDPSLPQYDDLTVNVIRPQRKLQGFGVMLGDRSRAKGH